MGSVISEDDEDNELEEEEEEEQQTGKTTTTTEPVVVCDDLEKVKDDWENLDSSAPDESLSTVEIGVGGLKQVEIGDKPITFAEFHTASTTALKSRSDLPSITPYLAPRRSSFKNLLSGKPTLNLVVEKRDEAFHLANVKYNPAESVEHRRILRTIYWKLTDIKLGKGGDTGQHWGLIGACA